MSKVDKSIKDLVAELFKTNKIGVSGGSQDNKDYVECPSCHLKEQVVFGKIQPLNHITTLRHAGNCKLAGLYQLTKES